MTDDWDAPKVTDNARLLSGYLAGAMSRKESELYALAELDAPGAAIVFEHTVTGNRYRVRVEQIGGLE